VARYVIKLGSSIVADDSGELRADVLERFCGEVAARHAAGDDVVVVTSTTSSPAEWRAAASAQMRSITAARSSPSSSATMLDPSLMT
jgi:glutamate 5-kinase